MHRQGLYHRARLKNQRLTSENARACYVGLMNNVSTPMMRTSLAPWPNGTEDFVNHQLIEDYIIALSRLDGLDTVIQYNTRVEEVRKTGNSWVVRTTSLTKDDTVGRRRISSKHWVSHPFCKCYSTSKDRLMLPGIRRRRCLLRPLQRSPDTRC